MSAEFSFLLIDALISVSSRFANSSVSMLGINWLMGFDYLIAIRLMTKCKIQFPYKLHVNFPCH